MNLENQFNLDKQKVLEKLYSFQRFGIKPGLERTLELLNSVNNPHQKLKFIHVAGTNGKGSVTSSLASILSESGYKVGLYTSPHIFEFNERIRINGEMISDDDVINYFNILLDKSLEIGATFFEITTVMALLYFAEQNLDIVVLETGMGGRFDSTNVVIPILTIITKIDLDHQEYLGNTIEDISKEKAGIIKHNVPVILNKNSNNVIEIIQTQADLKQSKFYYSEDLLSINLISTNDDLTSNYSIKIENNFVNLSSLSYLSGSHQEENLKSIIVTINLLIADYNFNITEIAVLNGLSAVKNKFGLRYRLDKITKTINNKNYNFYADVSHNPNSINSAINSLKSSDLNNLSILFSVMEDKDINLMLYYLIDYILENIIQNPKQKLVLTQINYSRAIKVDKLYDIALEILNEKLKYMNLLIDPKSKIIKIDNANEAFDYLMDINIKTENSFICLGSFYLFSELENKLRN